MVMRTTKRTYFEANRMISGAAKENNFAQAIFDSTNKRTDDFEPFDVALLNRLHDSLLASTRGLEYLVGRGINLDSIERFSLGYSENQDMVTVPVFSDNGIPVGFVARSIEGKQFKNSTNLPRSKVLFGLNKNKFEEVIVVESSFDAIKLNQMGFPAVATLGANVSREQLRLLEKYATKIILAPDSDEAGQGFAKKITDAVKTREISLIKIPEGKKDIGDMTREEILLAIDNKSLDILLEL